VFLVLEYSPAPDNPYASDEDTDRDCTDETAVEGRLEGILWRGRKEGGGGRGLEGVGLTWRGRGRAALSIYY